MTVPRTPWLTLWFGWVVSVDFGFFLARGFQTGQRHRSRDRFTPRERLLFPKSYTSLLGVAFKLRAVSQRELVAETMVEEQRPKQEAVAFSHVHLYADHLEELQVYKSLEEKLNRFAEQLKRLNAAPDLTAKQQLWESIVQQDDGPSAAELRTSVAQFVSHGRDVVKQLLAGFGFRITAACYPEGWNGAPTTRTVLVTSPDPQGVQILVTALAPVQDGPTQSPAIGQGSLFLDADRVRRFYDAHAQRPGIAILGFLAENVPSIYQRYKDLHPQLLAHYDPSDPNSILEVFAYYRMDHTADPGTVLRFVPATAAKATQLPLPGLATVSAVFGATATTQPAYCDHWVSNVWSRTEFLDTLRDTLGFTPKVDFNAGVVAAGEAQIESTVTGNDSPMRTSDRSAALKDQSQVYLPINNALSQVGHVHGFLNELGQGIQHLASRVDNLVDFVQNANEARQALGEGFTFLRIPRSYYGILDEPQLTAGDEATTKLLSPESAAAVVATLRASGVLSPEGAVDLDRTRDEIGAALEQNLSVEPLAEYRKCRDAVLEAIHRSRYKNLHSLLRDHLSEETYLRIVRNQILVDIQGEDLLFQIFTANILQRHPGHEAPFFEFIQRVCSECLDENGCPQKVRPGCGGFGIRNFLTLFLSIEVSKAMQEVSDAQACGDAERELYARQMVQYFTDQLSESNPILTEISDAMTDEGHCQEQVSLALAGNRLEDAAAWTIRRDEASKRKRLGNDRLMECSARYNSLMKELRERRVGSSGR